MATEPPKIPVSLRSKRIQLREQANAALELDNQGRHEEALAGAIVLVNNNRGISLVHKLLGILYQRKAVRLDSDGRANYFRESACAAFSNAALLAPKCLLTAVEHAEALAECQKYDEAYRELIRIGDVTVPVDPGQSYVGYENDKFSIRDTTYSDRLATAREKAANAMKRVEKQIQHRDTLSKVEEFWRNYPSKDTFNTVYVDELCQYHGRKDLSKSIYDACSFVEEHNQWGLLVWRDKEFLEIDLLCQDLFVTHEEVWHKLVDIVGADMSGLAAKISMSFPDIKLTKDDDHRDMLHLPSVEHLIAAMKVPPCAELPSEMEIKSKKRSEAVKVFEGIVEVIKGFTADMERAKVEEQIRSSWNNFFQACYFDYREVVLPLATKFQWEKLKDCMDEASEMQSYKEPSSLLLCSKCWKPGHGIKDCHLCIICDSSQHTIAHCPLTKEAKPLAHLVGYATPGQEFFIDNEPGRHVTAKISVKVGTLTTDQLVAEFFSQFDWGWDWSAKQLGHNLFVMKFPDLGKVEELSKSILQLENSGAMIRVSKRDSEPVPKAKLSRVWVTVDGVPESKKHYKSLCAIGSMVGAAREVDIEVLEEFDIVRIMVDVKDPQTFPLTKEYGVPPDLYDLYFSLESVITFGGAYEEGNNGNGKNLNSQGNHSHRYWSQTRPSSDVSHQSGGPSSSTQIGSGDIHAQSAGKKIVIGPYHGIIPAEPMGRLQSRLDFTSSSKWTVDNGAEEARRIQIEKDCELAIRLNKKLEGKPRRSMDGTFNADDVHENWEPEDKAALEQIWKLMDDHQDGADNMKVISQKNKPLRNPGKGGDVQKAHVKPSTLNRYGDLQTPSWLKTEKKLPPPDLPAQVFRGEEIPLGDVRKFALYCKAANNCPDKYTICHVCTFEGVYDRRILKIHMKDHFDKFHEQPGVSYECDMCGTRGRTSWDIRKHHHFVHMLSADWWPTYIPNMNLW